MAYSDSYPDSDSDVCDFPTYSPYVLRSLIKITFIIIVTSVTRGRAVA